MFVKVRVKMKVEQSSDQNTTSFHFSASLFHKLNIDKSVLRFHTTIDKYVLRLHTAIDKSIYRLHKTLDISV